MDIKSKDAESSVAFEAHYALEGRHGRVKIINDDRIVMQNAADARGRSELLQNGLVTQNLRIRGYYTHVKVGDIIRVTAPRYNIPTNAKNDRYIVTRVQTVFDAKLSYNILEAKRYD